MTAPYAKPSKIDSTNSELDAVYHSETMHEMLVKADLLDVDLLNPYVLVWLAVTTTYHHAFWPHTAKRFNAFKSILRRDRRVKSMISSTDGGITLYDFLVQHRDDLVSLMKHASFVPPGKKQELKNINQVIDIVEKCIASGQKKAKKQ